MFAGGVDESEVAIEHGPGIVLGLEGISAVYIGYRGNVTKCAPEAVRSASVLEQLSGGPR